MCAAARHVRSCLRCLTLSPRRRFDRPASGARAAAIASRNPLLIQRRAA